MHSGIVAHYVSSCGTEDQKKRWLPKLASGELVSAIAMTEPGTGSDLQNVKTKAIRDGDHYVLNGAKTFITNGAQAELIVVVAKTDPGEAAKGVSLVVLETEGAEGFRRGRVLDKIGMHGQDTAELFFDDVRVPVENLLGGEEGQGFVQLMQQLPQERLIIAVGAVAAMEAAVEQTIQYTKERTAFGREIFKFQNTRFKLAEAATEVAVCKAYLDQCIERHLKGELDVTGAAMVKWWTTDRLSKVADECLQLFGGYGYMSEYPISRAWTSRAGAADLRRHQRDHEGNHLPHTVTSLLANVIKGLHGTARWAEGRRAGRARARAVRRDRARRPRRGRRPGRPRQAGLRRAGVPADPLTRTRRWIGVDTKSDGGPRHRAAAGRRRGRADRGVTGRA